MNVTANMYSNDFSGMSIAAAGAERLLTPRSTNVSFNPISFLTLTSQMKYYYGNEADYSE
jgi:hypothetical protein